MARERKLVILRVEPSLHQTIRNVAEQDGRSMQNWAVRQLEQAVRQNQQMEQKRQTADN